MLENFLCHYGPNNTIAVPGIDFGAPLEIIQGLDPYVLVRTKGHLAWDGVGNPRVYIPTKYRLLLLNPEDGTNFRAETIEEIEVGELSYHQIMIKLKIKMEQLAAGYNGVAADEWVIYEVTQGDFYFGHITWIDNRDMVRMDKIKIIDGKEEEVKLQFPVSRILVRNTDFSTFDEMYHEAYLIRSQWLTVSAAISAHRKELDRQWYEARDLEKTSLEALRRKYKSPQ